MANFVLILVLVFALISSLVISSNVFAGSTVPDSGLTASTFESKYGDLIAKDGRKVTVLVKVVGDAESTEQNKREKEIRYLQTSVLKFVVFAGGINVVSDTLKNEFRAQVHPDLVELLEQRDDVISVTFIDAMSPAKQTSEGITIDNISCKTQHVLMTKYNGTPACVKPKTAEKLQNRGWGTINPVNPSIGLPSMPSSDETSRAIDTEVYSIFLNSKDLASDPILFNSLFESNEEFSKIENVEAVIREIDSQWTAVPKDEITSIMDELIFNDLSDLLRKNAEAYHDERRYTVYEEVFVTNAYGANIAQTGKTTDYRQDDESWWINAVNNGWYIEEGQFDESAGVFSIDISIRIEDDDGNLLGVMKTVTNIEDVLYVIDLREKLDLFAIENESKIKEMLELARNEQIVEILIESNEEFSNFEDPQSVIEKRDTEWVSTEVNKITPLMEELISNEVSDLLRDVIRNDKEETQFFVYEEIFVTNAYGANVAQTGKTEDYKQWDEDWWQNSKYGPSFDSGYDESAGVYSLDISLPVKDNDANFVGVLKAVVNIDALLPPRN